MPNQAQRAEAIRAHLEAMRPVIAELIASGVSTVTKISNELNARNIRAFEGGAWAPSQVSHLMRRLGFSR